MNRNPFLSGATFATSSSLLTATGSETVHDTTVALTYCIRGKAYSKSGTNVDQTTPTTDANTSAVFKTITGTALDGEASVFVWCYDKDGTVAVVQGEITKTDAAGYVTNAPEFPVIPDTLCPFAYQIIKMYGSAATFVFGTSNWNAATSSAIVDILTLPSRPQVA